MNTDSPTPEPRPDRPLGFWLRTVDHLLTAEFATTLEAEGVERRDWMLLSALSGDIVDERLTALLARKGKRLQRLEERGWVAQRGDGTWHLTDEGAAAHQRLGDIVAGIRTRVAGAVSPEDFATTLASLEAIARELGWDESQPLPRGRGRFGRRGFGGPGFGGPGFGGFSGFGHPGMRHGFGPRFRGDADPDAGSDEHRGFGPGSGPHAGRGCHGEPHHHGDHRGDRSHHGHRGERRAQHAYERGFDAGFARGRERDAS
ncbi:hypothetical protein N3K63_04755 [Microbacterium sp. W1N]|uniref:MarR family winged helix-turn-helix transcriptional regulator n=1 Tax=Microbacterium festucae TaxID=2977531 RepID=UPI0021C07CF0|nr:hypothetical protein [Microbacterium festucae]MCT9819593.1 hypothetical protein [Microbacterium festucae]